MASLYRNCILVLWSLAYLPTALAQVPTITSFTPGNGPTGTAVTITGTNFNATPANNTVFFGAVKAAVTGATATSLNVTVPAGATYNPISVTIGGLSAFSKTPFDVTFTVVGHYSANDFGNNSLLAKIEFAAGSKPFNVALGDIDGDGLTDIISSNSNGSSISVFRNTSKIGFINTSSFAAKVDFTTDATPRGIAVADLDGNGKLDVAVATASGISMLRNTSTPGTISFATKVDVSASATGTVDAIAVGDLDKDGKPDLVVSKGLDNNFAVFRNTGSVGTVSMAAAFTITAGSDVEGVTIGDVDGDGKAEILATNRVSNTFSVFRNISTPGSLAAGSFAAKVDFATPTGPYKIRMSDIDLDGKQDVVVSCSGSATIAVFRNTGSVGTITSGSFAASVNIQPGAYQKGICISDIDGDGKPDLGFVAMGLYRNVSTPGSITTGSFVDQTYTSSGSQPEDVVIGDLDGDSKPEFVIADDQDNTVSVVYNNGPVPTLEGFSVVSGPVGSSVFIYGDNFSPVPANNIVFFGATRANVTAATSTQLTVTVPVGATNKPVSVTVNGHVGITSAPFKVTFPSSLLIDASSLAPPTNISQYFSMGTSEIYRTVMADLDNDGKPDLITANGLGNSLSISKNTATPGSISASTFAAKFDIALGATVTWIAVEDLNGDGKPDIVTANPNSNTISILRNVSTTGVLNAGSFAAKVDLVTGAYPWRVAIADIDRDGKPDIASTNSDGGTVSLFRNVFTSAVITTNSFLPKVDITIPGAHPEAMLLADLDNDYKPDLVVSGGGKLSIFQNKALPGVIGPNSFAGSIDVNVLQVREILSADLDGDFRIDLILPNGGTTSVSVLRNVGTFGVIDASTFAASVDFPTNGFSMGAAVDDLDGDGKTDIVVANYNTISASVLKNTTTGSGIPAQGSFAAKVDFTGYYARRAIIADVDGDGKPDVVFANMNGTSNYVSVFRNTNTLSPPVAGAATSISQTGFTANWAAASGATEYRLDVSTNNFAGYVSGFQDLPVTGTSKAVTGLSIFSPFQYRLRSVNASGLSVNSNVITGTTVTATPVAIAATSITASGFTANWNAVTGATSYELDVSLDNFNTFAGIYNSKSVTGTSDAVTSLLSNTSYAYRLRSSTVSGSSPNSGSIAVLTVPAAPVNLASNNFVTFIDATWNAATGNGAATYQLDISRNDFVTIDQTFSNLSITSQRISNLLPNTDYKIRVRAVNATNASANSIPLPAHTASVSSGDPLKIDGITAPTTVADGFNQVTITIKSTGGTGNKTVQLWVRPIAGEDFESIDATDVGDESNNYEAVISESMLDELGLEYYVEVTDQAPVTVQSNSHSFIRRTFAANTAIPFTSAFNGTAATYQMFSVPYMITDKNVASVFVNQGGADKTKWRLLHYQENRYIEYPDNITNIEIGKGYWFNTKEKTVINSGAGVTVNTTKDAPFSLPVVQGWNQIGNPYPFNLTWQVVKDADTGAGINSLWVFESGRYEKKDVLAKWKAAFVFCDNDGTLVFPVTARTLAGGRVNNSSLGQDIDRSAWQIPVTLELNGLVQESGIGMHPDASTTKDKFDEMAVPRFIDYLELTTTHHEFFSPYFATDVVPPIQEKSWVFTANSNQEGGQGSLHWDRTSFADASAALSLIDLQDGIVIDMKKEGQYSFSWSDGKQFKIIFGQDGELRPGVTLLGTAFPNPFAQRVTIPVLLESDQDAIQIEIYDMMGRRVKTLTKEAAKAGVHTLEWDGRTAEGTETEGGLYLYQLRGDKGVLGLSKRLIKQ